MAIRTIDIARRLGLSVSSIRKYEAYGLVPPVPRGPNGYRLYTEEHVAYMVCARAMQPGFTQPQIAAMFKAIRAGRMAEAYWLVTQLQSELQQDRQIARRIEKHLLHEAQAPVAEAPHMTIRALHRRTDIPVTTLRYWDNVGLLPALRDAGNRYRLYTEAHVTRALTLYALKLSTYASHGKYYIETLREDAQRMDPSNRALVEGMLREMYGYLDDINASRIAGIAALHTLCQQLAEGTPKGP